MTIPNLITIIRFLLVPAVVYALLLGEWGWAFVGFVVAGVSDAVDGFIARHFNQASALGSYLDPVADKVLLVSVFIVLGYLDQLPLWLVIAVVSRDALIVCAVVLSSLMGNPVEMKPLPVSKLNTAVQIVLAAFILGEQAFGADTGLMRMSLIAANGLLTIASTAAYLVAWLRHMTTNGEKSPSKNG
ncbi:MAG: CDP-alcohol phosphatidyltransferase family protein [Rhizobiaceae bacterium]|nr:CDP-alcohol phosphatidyltransferase family protein [Rhizobiaceae bacterium]